jgi:UDP-N-acetylmuramoyl-L-alanyl-D-glutamate--2,6-diaminopimelate ligase
MTSISLHSLLAQTAPSVSLSAPDVPVESITSDSRQVQPGSIFVALRGERVNGHQFIPQALNAGAALILAEPGVLTSLPQRVLETPDTRLLWAQMASILYGPDSASIRKHVVGVTGTNGKTTCTHLLEAVLQQAEWSPGIIGTVAYRVGEQKLPAPFTTPTPTLLWETLGQLQELGADSLVMEVSSHALTLHRADALEFEVAMFTNLTQDHLDFHGDFDSYLAAKTRLFSELVSPDGRSILNADDDTWTHLKQASRAPVWSYSRERQDVEIRVLSQELTAEGIRAELETPAGPMTLESPLVGDFNLSNLLSVIGAALALGIAPEIIAAGLAAQKPIPGRLEPVASDTGVQVLVDYAHTPDALHNTLRSVKALCRGRLLTVFGCGGDRDRSKRPLMGRAAAEQSDLCFVTSDNPRTEEPTAILEDILPGVLPLKESLVSADLLSEAVSGVWTEVDREKAIHLAIAAARPDDIVVIAGKGHEDYQIIGTTKRHFDDREVARAALSLRSFQTTKES